MRIDKLVIKNFKGFADEVFHLNPQFTVFIGDNAKGKTSVLDALAVAMGSFLRGIDVVRTEARKISKNEVRTLTIEGQPKPQLPVEIQAFGSVGGEEIAGGWMRNVDELTKKTTTKFVKAKNIEKIANEMLQKSRSEGNVTFPIIAYHGTGRLWAEHEIKKSSSKEVDVEDEKIPIEYKKQEEGVAMAYINCLSPKSSSKEFLSWYKTYEDELRKFNQESDQLWLNTFNNCVSALIPDEHWQDMAFSFADDDLVGFFTTTDGTNEKLLFSQLSDGYRNVIGMAADIAYRCIKLNPHLKERAILDTPGIVLIDELDMHLHPNWQRRIVNDLKNSFPKIQFVATTHSPFIVQSLHEEELVILDEDLYKDGHPNRKTLETIASGEMGITDVPRSVEFTEMLKVAEEYYRLISNEQALTRVIDIEQLRNRLNELEEKFGEDPAFIATLKIERETRNL